MPGVSGNKSLSAPVKTLEEPEIIEPSVIPSEAKNLAEANAVLETVEPSVIPSEAKNLAEANAEPESDLAVADEANVTPETNNVIPSEAKNLAEANAEPETDLAVADEANVTHETNYVIPSEAKNLAEANAVLETVEPSVIPSEAKNLAEANAEPESDLTVADEANTEPDADETTIEPEIIEPVKDPAAEPVERQSETAEESVSIIDDELMRFKAATEGFDRLEKFTFKIFKDVFDNYSGVFVTARQTLADLLLFIAAKCKNAGKIEDFKRAFNVNKDFGELNQSAANYIPVLLGLTLKLKAQSDFVSGVFNEIRGILLNIICDETAVEFELKILKQLLF